MSIGTRLKDPVGLFAGDESKLRRVPAYHRRLTVERILRDQLPPHGHAEKLATHANPSSDGVVGQALLRHQPQPETIGVTARYVSQASLNSEEREKIPSDAVPMQSGPVLHVPSFVNVGVKKRRQCHRLTLWGQTHPCEPVGQHIVKTRHPSGRIVRDGMPRDLAGYKVLDVPPDCLGRPLRHLAQP